MSIITKISNFLKNPKARIIRVLNTHASWFSDKSFIKLKYRLEMGKRLNLKNPKSFNEKIQWLKLYNHKPVYTVMVDKYLAKEYVANLIGEQYIIPTIGMWQTPDDIDIASLPNQFVLKTTHGAGNSGVIICKDKNDFDFDNAKSKLWKSLNTNTYLYTREWPYKEIKPCIIAEKYLEDIKTKELRDYKLFCFDGVVKALFVATARQINKEPYFDFYDTEFHHLNIRQGHSNANFPPEKPECFEEMKKLASILSKGIPQVRVDFYEVNGKVYFGEMTFYHFSGMVPFEPNEIDVKWGSWIKLPIDK